MRKKKIVILGAGLTGLSSAYYLRKHKIDPIIFEKENTSGGLCRSKFIKGFTFDYSGHVLHFRDNYTLRIIKDLLNGNIVRRKRMAEIYCFDRFIPYPFQANLRFLPFHILSDCVLGFLKTDLKNFKKNDVSFSDWIYRKFGRGIADYFMLPYNKKFWCHPLKKMSCGWVDGYIPLLSTELLLKGASEGIVNYKGYNDIFWYPKQGGIQSLILAFSNQFDRIYNNYEAQRIDLKSKKIYFKNGTFQKYDCLISTIPLVELINMIDRVPRKIKLLSKKLKWISIFNLNLGIRKRILFKQHWIYFPEKKFIFFRVGFPHNFSRYVTPKGMDSLYVEVSYPMFKRIDEDRLILRIIRELKEIGVIKYQRDIVVIDYNKIKYAYVIYTLEHRSVLKKIFEFLRKHNIYSIGRYGSWKYATMEDCILGAKSTVTKILSSYA